MTQGRLPHILAARHRHVLDGFTASTVLVAFDFDGALAPIVQTPPQARMRAVTRRLLIHAAQRYPCAVISGRPLADLTRRLAGVPLRRIFGNLGHEPPPPGRTPPTRVSRWVALLNARLGQYAGLVVEDKIYSVAVHYRHVAHKPRVVAAIHAAVAELAGVRMLPGAEAVVLLPWPGPDKGSTLQRARRLEHCDRAIFVGDDGTDEDAFASGPAERLLPIRVGGQGPTAARFCLGGQDEVDDLLRVLLASRPKPRKTR